MVVYVKFRVAHNRECGCADGDDDLSLDALRAHKLVYNKARPGDDMARTDNVDDLVVSQR